MLQLESDYAARAGVGAYRGFATSLAALYRGLQIPTHANPAFSAAAGRSIGVLPLVAMRIQQDLMSATIARGHPALKLSFAQVIPLIGPRGGRVHEIARLQRTSRQAISATARELAALGYVRRDADPHDGRGALLVLTTSGSRLILDSLASLDALESRFGEILGKARLASLQRVARDLYRSLHLEQAIFEDASDVEPLQSSARSALALAPDDIERIAMRLHAELGDAAAEHLALRLSLRARRTA
jgi:DNA-binding MarR family transcriptional regulator